MKINYMNLKISITKIINQPVIQKWKQSLMMKIRVKQLNVGRFS